MGNVYRYRRCLFKDDLLYLSANCILDNLNGHRKTLVKDDLLWGSPIKKLIGIDEGNKNIIKVIETKTKRFDIKLFLNKRIIVSVNTSCILAKKEKKKDCSYYSHLSVGPAVQALVYHVLVFLHVIVDHTSLTVDCT